MAYEYRVGIERVLNYDVVTVGGGPAGFAAAVAAARNGARVLLVDGQGQLGGMGTSGLVSHWLGGRTGDCREWVVGGIFRELSERAAGLGMAALPRRPDGDRLSPYGWERGQLNAGVPFDPYRMAALLDEVAQETGVDVLLQTSFVDAVVAGDRIEQLIIHNKSGLQLATARVFIDATGDADVAARSGCQVVKGRESDQLMAPATLEMHLDGVDAAALSDYIHRHASPRFLPEIAAWTESGEWPFIFNRFISVMLNEDDIFMINTSRLCDIDGTDGRSVSEGLRRGRRENLALLDFIRRKIPGMDQARLKAMGTLLGVRESRRIAGTYTLTVDDLVRGEPLHDVIGFSSYGWDLPDPKRPSFQPMAEKKRRIAHNRTPLPFRMMQPQPIRNLLCPGRAVSVERDVLGPVRVMAPCMAMGQAAGLAAAMAVAERDLSRIEIPCLREALRLQGAIID